MPGSVAQCLDCQDRAGGGQEDKGEVQAEGRDDGEQAVPFFDALSPHRDFVACIRHFSGFIGAGEMPGHFIPELMRQASRCLFFCINDQMAFYWLQAFHTAVGEYSDEAGVIGDAHPVAGVSDHFQIQRAPVSQCDRIDAGGLFKAGDELAVRKDNVLVIRQGDGLSSLHRKERVIGAQADDRVKVRV